MSSNCPDSLLADFTPQEWRAHRKLSKSSHHKLKHLGLAPDEIRVPGTTIIRITKEADLRWQERMAALASEKAALVEQERRVELCRRAGRRAALSAMHVSNRKRVAAASPRHISKKRGA
jgi:hypothetical protein